MKNVKNSMMGFLINFLLLTNLSSCQKDLPVIKETIATNTFLYPNDSTFLKTYIKAKPRLILTKERLQYLRNLSAQDTVLSRYIKQCIITANWKINTRLPVYSHIVDAPGAFLNESWSVLNTVPDLSFAYLWTGDVRYAKRVKEILLTVASYPDWNPDHFLDVAIMGFAVSFGFDWLYNYYDQPTRDLIVKALVDKCLEPGRQAFMENAKWGNSWINVPSNWNFVCNSSLITTSLAVAEWHKEYANIIIPHAVQSLPLAINRYSPDGAWEEGISYDQMSLTMYSYCLSSLSSSLNNIFNLDFSNGINKAGYFYLSLEGYSKYMLCYADIAEKAVRPYAPCLFYLGTLFNKDDLILNEQKFIESKTATVFHVIWYKPISGSQFRTTNEYFGGTVPIVVFNDDKYGNNSIYIGAKGGLNGSSGHNHLDLGNFELDALGIRWVRDLGMDNYSIPCYFCGGAGGQRWNYYRVSSLSHNVPIINDENQDIQGSATFKSYSLRKDLPYCIIDLSDPYKKYVDQLNRGIKLIDANRSIIIQDEYSLITDQECYWGMTTDATIVIVDTKTAKLMLNGKELYAKIISPANGAFSVISAYQAPPQNPNTGVSRLIAKKPKDGVLNFSITVQLSPVWNGYYSPGTTLVPLSQWR